MAATSPIVDQYGQPLASPRVEAANAARARAIGQLRARYDSAQTTPENARHWANADLLSADAANNPAVRARIRSRARYEAYESNSFCSGLVRTKVAYTVGDGPRLQFTTKNRGFNTVVEKSFRRWARKIRLGKKLRQMAASKCVDGEGLGLLVNNSRLAHEVKLDIQVRETDELTTPDLFGTRPDEVDGLKLDELGNPLRYALLKHHPGGQSFATNPLAYDWIDAQYVLHWFHGDRPGVHRGMSELAPALPLFAQVRRFALAVLAAAETAADFAAVMYADNPTCEIDDDVDPLDAIELEMRAMLTLPKGWKLGQIDAKQPTTTFEMFRDAMWNEAARCVLAPYNIAAGNSAKYNYASGRLDHQVWDLVIDIERDDLETIVLDKLFEMWLREFLSARSGIAPSDIDLSNYSWRWYWPPREHVDPAKNALAKQILWEMGIITDEDIWLEEGLHPTDQEDKLQRQLERRARLKLPLPGEKPAAAPSQPADRRPQEDDEARDDDDIEACAESQLI